MSQVAYCPFPFYSLSPSDGMRNFSIQIYLFSARIVRPAEDPSEYIPAQPRPFGRSKL
jgi:hypothetical protein